MVKYMATKNKTNVIEHITYPYNEITKKIFFQEKICANREVYFNGKKITSVGISDELSSFLETKGFTIIKSERVMLMGRKMVCGVGVSVSTSRMGKDIIDILITLNANDHEELVNNKKALINGVKSITNVKCKTATTDKFVEC